MGVSSDFDWSNWHDATRQGVLSFVRFLRDGFEFCHGNSGDEQLQPRIDNPDLSNRDIYPAV